MGVGISDWVLANIVCRQNELGVVSGTALDGLLIRRLQRGDPGGHMRRAMEKFPVPEIADNVYEKYFVLGGKPENKPFTRQGMFRINNSKDLLNLTVLANFVEVYLAKEGHNNPVGINYLEKIQMPHLSSIYGAMLADVDYVLMGAGIPRQIPGILDSYVKHQATSYKVDVKSSKFADSIETHFDPKKIVGKINEDLKRPEFLAIISSNTLANSLIAKCSGKVNGFVIELHPAGGHNAAPRGKYPVNDKGEPIYGVRDEVDFEKIKDLGLPFWLAGGYGSPEGLKKARSLGAQGIQVGTLFFLSDESGLYTPIKREVLKNIRENGVDVLTDKIASPTGFPFKVVSLAGTNSEEEVYKSRKRVCDVGYLRTAYRKDDGNIGYRCPSEPEKTFLKKGGKEEDMLGRKCLCNGLIANLGLGQLQKHGEIERPLLTGGDDINKVKILLNSEKDSYSAVEVINYLRS